jgi:hypothetical protein
MPDNIPGASAIKKSILKKHKGLRSKTGHRTVRFHLISTTSDVFRGLRSRGRGAGDGGFGFNPNPYTLNSKSNAKNDRDSETKPNNIV